ncbi:MAG: Xaa-Pro peptidase family protein [Planctomycetota bacterium]|nr:Xaa-Pro peptidase family protein [Planctomycetota bacterium]
MPPPKSLAFDLAEYHRRVAAVQAAMAERDLDLLLATTMASICYLTGLESVAPHKFWLVAVPRSGPPVLLCQDFESHNALLGSWIDATYLYGVGEEPIALAAKLVNDLGARAGRIGTEQSNYTSLSIADYLRLKSLLPAATLAEATDLVPRVMAIKSAPEIAHLREAGRITGEAMAAAVGAIRAGATDNDVAAAAYHALVAGGSEYSSYPVIVTTGHRSGVPHSTFRRHPIRAGDPVFMEIAACVARYQTPMMRTAALGEPTRQLRDMARAAIDSVEAMIANIRRGATADHVAELSSRCLDPLPYKLVWHGYYGYSVGLGFPPEWSDCPWLLIKRGNPELLRPGMVFHCSTSLRDVGLCGATCSETILVTETGCEVLTRGSRELVLR